MCTGERLPSRRQSGDSPHYPWKRITWLVVIWKRGSLQLLTSFPSGVCRDDGSPGVLDSINVNCPVIMYSIPVWVILTDDGYFLCFPLLFGCCKADLEVAVRTSASWESSDCCTGVNDCNIWVWLCSPPGCSSLCCYSRWLGHWPRQATVTLWSSHHWRQLERTSSFHNGWNMILQPVLCSPLKKATTAAYLHILLVW